LPVLIAAIVISAIVFAPLCSWLALQRGRSWLVWFLFGIPLGPIAAALLIAAPPGQCAACGTRSRGWPQRCAGCGLDFAEGRPDTDSFAVDRGVVSAPDGRPSLTIVPRPAGVAGHGPDASDGWKEPIEAAQTPGRRAGTSIGRSPSAIRTSSSPSRRSAGTVAILGSGVFIGGTEPLQIGGRYQLARVGQELQALGPMHVSPSALAARVQLIDTQATLVGDRLLITTRDGDRGPTLAFSSVSAERGIDFQEELRGRSRRKAAAR
jgi:hypothetical protein